MQNKHQEYEYEFNICLSEIISILFKFTKQSHTPF